MESLETFAEFDEAFGAGGRELEEEVFDWERIKEYRGEFSLMTSELYEPLEDLGGEAGFDCARLGPGEAYQRWRESSAYPEWRERVAEALR